MTLPRVINLQAVDICNSRCVMCNIWKDGKRETLTLDQLRTFLGQAFFREVTHVGVTGGEPTLRKDLLELYQALPQVLPNLVGASFITHGMQTDRAVSVYTKVHELYRGLKLTFEGMVSLDGVGVVHDQVRGRKGAFEAASKTLLELKRLGVPAMAACTIVRRNVYGLHDLLNWGRANGVYVRFRVAEFIRRLYNDGCTPEIRSFTTSELRHLVSFFHLLLTGYERDEKIRKTYTSILSLLTGGERLIGCPYQDGRAINLDSRGEVACCAPKGAAIKLPEKLTEAQAELESQRAEVMRDHCAHCIHDYHDDWNGVARVQGESARRCQRELYDVAEDHLTVDEVPGDPLDLSRMKKVLLTGWYGTETAGDIAILQGIISEYLNANPDLRFQILSLYPFYTRTTVDQWPEDMRSRVEIFDYSSEEAGRSAEACDAVVMAGGPLMDIPETRKILCLFRRFAEVGKPRVIEGCGVGPLHHPRYRWNVCRLARLATRISVRDGASRDTLRLLGIRKAIEVRNDPAVTFLRAQGIRHSGKDGKVIRCFLRELTSEYRQSITPDQATANLLLLVKRLLDWYPEHRIELWAMHHFPVGNDDRLFAQRLVRAVGDARLSFDWEPRTPREIMAAMAGADFCVCMRFHSCVFAHEVGVPFLAIDYTAGGKIQGFLEDVGGETRLCRLGSLEQLERSAFEAKIRSRNTSPTPLPDSVVTASAAPVVLHIIEGLIGGGGARAMISVARELRKINGTRHRVVSLHPADATGLALAREAGVEVLQRPGRNAVNRAISEADVVIVHWWNSPELAELFRRELPPMRLALWLHIGGYHLPHVLTRSLIEFADLTVACSPHTYAHPVFEELTADVRRQSTAMVLAGADFDRLEGIKRRAHDGFRVGYLGTLDPVKMHPDYVAMSCAVGVPEVKFVVCGYGDMRWLKTAAEQRGRSESFDFRGPVDDIRALLEELDVYGYPLCPDTYAAAELNLQEAMYAGLPVVAFPYGGIGRLIRHGETGWLVNSAEEYARAIEFLHAHPEERARLGGNAAAFARQNWGATNAAKAFDGHVANLLEQPKRVRQWDLVPANQRHCNPACDLAIHPAARMFIESLGEGAEPFRVSAISRDVQEAMEAETRIGQMPRVVSYVYAVRYRAAHPADPLINLWAGLSHLHSGRANEASACFELAAHHGFTHWRVHWYRALAAERAGKSAAVHTLLEAVLRAVPDFQPALELQRRVPRVATENAQELVQQAQQFMHRREFGKAREKLARALVLVPGQPLLMELLADLELRLGNVEAARKLVEAIREREPTRATPRLQAMQAHLTAQCQ